MDISDKDDMDRSNTPVTEFALFELECTVDCYSQVNCDNRLYFYRIRNFCIVAESDRNSGKTLILPEITANMAGTMILGILIFRQNPETLYFDMTVTKIFSHLNLQNWTDLALEPFSSCNCMAADGTLHSAP